MGGFIEPSFGTVWSWDSWAWVLVWKSKATLKATFKIGKWLCWSSHLLTMMLLAMDAPLQIFWPWTTVESGVRECKHVLQGEGGGGGAAVAICQLAFMIGEEMIRNIWISSDLNSLFCYSGSMMCTFQFLLLATKICSSETNYPQILPSLDTVTYCHRCRQLPLLPPSLATHCSAAAVSSHKAKLFALIWCPEGHLQHCWFLALFTT